MGELPQALEIIFGVQRKKINEKITRRKMSFPRKKIDFVLFWTSLSFKPHNFLVSYSVKTI